MFIFKKLKKNLNAFSCSEDETDCGGEKNLDGILLFKEFFIFCVVIFRLVNQSLKCISFRPNTNYSIM